MTDVFLLLLVFRYMYCRYLSWPLCGCQKIEGVKYVYAAPKHTNVKLYEVFICQIFPRLEPKIHVFIKPKVLTKQQMTTRSFGVTLDNWKFKILMEMSVLLYEYPQPALTVTSQAKNTWWMACCSHQSSLIGPDLRCDWLISLICNHYCAERQLRQKKKSG